MPIEIEVPADRARVIRLLRLAYGWQFWAFRAAGALVAACGIAAIAFDGSDLLFVEILIIGYGLFLIVAPWLVNGIGGRKNPCNQASRVTIDDAGVTSRTATSTGQFTWAAFRRAEISRTDVVLLVRPRGYLGFPLDAVATADRDRVTTLLAAHGLLDAPR